ncbi:GMC oxidoreductase [Paracoccus sp. IB05]|uniref:GMC oxidoreductase n=1 Tax=Paracoccus sp. IB05 TaxID=2779367 RepID=UPI0018E8A159|nr:GMC family oxidoreductase [Paracoccus sp. IB05]MBJ2151322.1 GMC family oxidoreductase [Paracoccus sp. IB05]
MSPDIIIIGAGIGGATLASALAPSGARVLILERGEALKDCPEARDPEAIFRHGYFRPDEMWVDAAGGRFNPGNYYHPGGNSKFYGAVLMRYREVDFAPLRHMEGLTPGWPFAYQNLERYYSMAEALYQVRGAADQDPTEPPRSAPLPFPPVPDEPTITALRRAFQAQGLHPAALPLGVDIGTWLQGGATTWDAFPNTRGGKMDAETCALAEALKYPNVTLMTGARVTRLLAANRKVTGVELTHQAQRLTLSAPLICLCAGAVVSAALLLASADSASPAGLANSSDQVGRNFMNHNLSAVIGFNPLRRNTSVYAKTIQLNDWYLTGGQGGTPLGNIQMLGRVTGPILAAESGLPRRLAGFIADHSVHMMTMSEDLPKPESRVIWRGGQIHLQWERSNMAAHGLLSQRLKTALRRAGWPIVFTKEFGKRTPSHQCGTCRMGADPRGSVVDPDLKAHDFDNLYIADASVLPTSAAVNPSLTIAALALRLGAHLTERRAA